MRPVHLLLALAVAGCAEAPRETAAPPPPASPTAPSPTPSPLPTTSRCENLDGGYALEHPAAWSVAGGDGIEPCTFFDPEPLALEPGTEVSGVAVRADVRDVPLEQARRDTGGEQQERTVGGLAAVRATGTYTDEALLPPGTRFTTWLVDLGGRTLLLTTDSASGADHAGVLDAMAQTVQAL